MLDFTHDAPGTVVALPNAVQRLKRAMLRMEQYQPETKHHFHGGMYCREVLRAADVTVVGKVHLKEHFYLVAEGTVKITTDDGVKEVTGPHLMKCKPGTQRAVYAVTDALCMTFHITDATTPDEAEAELVEDDPDCPFLVGNLLPGKALK